MRRILLPLLLLVALTLTGCGTLLERSYASVTPHTQFSDLSENEDILRAETYQGLVSALLHLVEQGAESGQVRLYQYSSITGSATGDVDQACLEVTQEDSADSLRQAVLDAYQARLRPLPALDAVDVTLYPDKGPQRVAEIRLTWAAGLPGAPSQKPAK